MRINEVKLLVHQDLAKFICLEDSKFVSCINKLSKEEFSFRSEIEAKVEGIFKKMAIKSLNVDAYQLANLYLSLEERTSIYYKFCMYSFLDYSNEKSADALCRLEERLKLDKLETLHIREDFFRRNYLEDADFSNITKGMLSYFWISFANDGVIDKGEWDYFKSISKKLELPKNVAITKFDLVTLVKFSSVNLETMKKIKKLLLGAALSDGVVQKSESGLIKKIINLLDISHLDSQLSMNSQLLMTMAVMLSDGKLTNAEKNWFGTIFKAVGKPFSMNEGFIFLDLVHKNTKMYFENKEFFSTIWGAKDKNFELVSRLYMTYAKYYLKNDSEKLLILEESLQNRSVESIKFIKKIKNEEVTSEELMLLYGILTSDFYCLKKFNSSIDYKYIEKNFLNMKSTNTDIGYFFIASALMLDAKVVAGEYDLIWKKCEKLNLDFSKLERAIRNLALLNQKHYRIDTYHTYLNKEL